MLYRSASLHGFDFGTALYATQAFFDDKNDPIARIRPGKDFLSRFDYVNTGNKSFGVIGQAYGHYSWRDSGDITVGRQLVETFYTRSNDSKMIPNTFDGVVAHSSALADSILTLAYLSEQKLRDHSQSHALLMVGDANSSNHINPQHSENDDSVMHRGLTYTALTQNGKPTNAPLIIAEVKNSSIENLTLHASSYLVPSLLAQGMIEADYSIKASKTTVTPGVRYIQQFDQGAGAVGGASYTGNSSGYTNPTSLNAQMIAARIITTYKTYRYNLAYTQVLNKADLITPWRGFPTGGYTRSMGIYNWRANTKSVRLELQHNKNSIGDYRNIYLQSSLLYINSDEKKNLTSTDRLFYYLGLMKNFSSLPNFYVKLRLGYAQFLNDNASQFNYLDSRFELNYLF